VKGKAVPSRQGKKGNSDKKMTAAAAGNGNRSGQQGLPNGSERQQGQQTTTTTTISRRVGIRPPTGNNDGDNTTIQLSTSRFHNDFLLRFDKRLGGQCGDVAMHTQRSSTDDDDLVKASPRLLVDGLLPHLAG